MANYTKEEIEAFKKKDQMNCRQSALKAASLVFEGTGCDLVNPTKTVLDDAKEYYAWLYPTVDAEPAKSADVLPTPTAAQKKVLDAIQDKTGIEWDILRKVVLQWAKEIHKISKYPENLSSVTEFIKWNDKGE